MRYTLKSAYIQTLFLLVGALICRIGAAQDTSPESNSNMTSTIFVEQQTECMTISDIKSALASVMDSREETKYMIVTVVVSPAVEGSLAILRAIDRETGEILLERRLNVSDEECDDAHRVLKVMMEQFLTGFPIEKWKEKQVAQKAPPKPIIKTEKIVVKEERVPLQWLFMMAVDSRWPTPSGDLVLTLGADAGGKRHGFIGHLVLENSLPRELGEGKYLETSALLGVGVRLSPRESLRIRTEVRSGAKRVSGFDYEKNYQRWVILIELHLTLLFRLGSIYLGPEIGVSPLFHTVYTETGEKEDLPWLRIGLALCIPLWKSFLK